MRKKKSGGLPKLEFRQQDKINTLQQKKNMSKLHILIVRAVRTERDIQPFRNNNKDK